MTTAAAFLACLLLGAFTVFQALLACRLPLGRFAWGGQYDVLPARLRVGSVLAIAVYLVFGWVIAAHAGLLGADNGVVRAMTWAIAGYFFLGAGANLASRSRPERVLMTPLAVALCGLTAAVAAR